MKVKALPRKNRVTVELKREDDAMLERSVKAAGATRTPFQIARILVPVDFSGPSAKALAYALTFAAQCDAKMILLHVVEPAVYPENFMTLPSGYEGVNRDLVSVAKERLDKLIEEQVGREIATEAEIRLGRAYAEITEAAADLRADLIILATHGYTGLKHVLMGSTAELVVRHAPCPVLVVREKEQDFIKRK